MEIGPIKRCLGYSKIDYHIPKRGNVGMDVDLERRKMVATGEGGLTQILSSWS